MKPARYRNTDFELESATRALEILLQLDTLRTIVGTEDPLCDAARIAERVLLMALRVSPIPEVATPRTVQEHMHLWHGPDALKHAEQSTPVMRKKLDDLSAFVFGLRAGPASERKDLVTHVVHAGYELLDDLAAPQFVDDRAVLLQISTDLGEADRVRRLMAMTFDVVGQYQARHRKGLSFWPLLTAVIACAQEGARGRRAGSLKKGLFLGSRAAAARLTRPDREAWAA